MERNLRHGTSHRINNPFPSQPAGLGFVKGDLLFNAAELPSQSHTAGQGFEVQWRADGGGSLQVYHTSEPERALWSSLAGKSFVSAALGRDSFEESRGSFAIHDYAEISCGHQTVEQILLAWPSEVFGGQFQPPIAAAGYRGFEKIKGSENSSTKLTYLTDADGIVVGNRGPCIIVTGCLYADPILAKLQLIALGSRLNSDRNSLSQWSMDLLPLGCGPFYRFPDFQNERSHWSTWTDNACLPFAPSQEWRAGVRYWLVFYETREHQLGFSVRLDQPQFCDDTRRAGRNYNSSSKLVMPNHLATAPATDSGMVLDGFSGIFGKNIAPRHIDSSVAPDQKHWLWSNSPVSAFPKHNSISAFVASPVASGYRATPFLGLRSISLENLRALGHTKTLHDSKRSTTPPPPGSHLAGLLLSGIKFKQPSEFVLSPSGHWDDEQRFQLPKFNRVQLTYASSKDENFFGFGEQFSQFNFKGRRVPILVQEQGIGRGDQPITALANLVSRRAGGDWHTTYAPVPYYMTSEMRSLYLEGYEYSVFDLTQNDAVQVQVHAGHMDGRILHGRNPVEIIERYTASIGRMRELPEWMLRGAIVGMQGGSDAVRKVWQQLQDLEVPLAAFWLQDWVGQRKTSVGWQLWWNWEVDRDHYPGWEELVQEFQTQGIRTLAYCNPLLVSTKDKSNRKRDLLEEAERGGFLVGNKSGGAYMIPATSFDSALVDLTNPAARKWLKGILRDMVKTGIRGWMADFGEALPLDASLFSQEDPRIVHNKYPELWAELNREFAEEWEAEQRELKRNIEAKDDRLPESPEGLDEQLVFFMRAGYRGSPRWSTLFWEGDQMVSWQRNDGIKSAVTGLLTSGLSGYSLNHSDIGGYCSVDVPLLKYRRSEELLLRWMELNSFSTIYRTHEGNVPAANSQFFSNQRTLHHFSRFGKLYKAWEFYRLTLVKEAAASGLPVVRHLFLHYPRDPHVQTFTFQQFLVGTEILVVPVLDKGQKGVNAYFPRSDVPEAWEHVWTGKVYSSSPTQGLNAWMDAPLGFPAFFIRKGSSVGCRFRQNLIDEGILRPANRNLNLSESYP